MSDTPRTDANIVVGVYGDVNVPVDFARQLERELTEALEALRSIQYDHADDLQRVADMTNTGGKAVGRRADSDGRRDADEPYQRDA